MAFVVVQHLERDRANCLWNFWLRTALPVVEVSDGMVVEREHIYVAPPDRRLIMREGAVTAGLVTDGAFSCHRCVFPVAGGGSG